MIATLLDAVLAFAVLEAIGLAAFHRRTGRGLAPRAFLANLAAGFCLVVAARLAAARGTATPLTEVATAAMLAAAGFAHLLDLAGRWRA